MSNNNNGYLSTPNPRNNMILTNVGSGGTGSSGTITVLDSSTTWTTGGWGGGSGSLNGLSGNITLQTGTSYTFPSATLDMASYFNTVMEGQLQQDPDAFATSLNQILKNHPDLLEELQRKLDRDAMTRDLKEMVEGNEEQDTP